jgi:hypothetical protein
MGFIYLLYNDAGFGYIGQTSKDMNTRIAEHKSKGNKCRSKILGEFDWLVLEEVADEDLLDFERYYYDVYNEMFPDMLVNRNVPLRTKKEGAKATYKKYRDKKLEYCRIYNEANKEKILEYSRDYREANKEKMLVSQRDNYAVNKEKVNQRRRELYRNKRKLITN